MKSEYKSPEMEIITLSTEDIITTSLIDGGDNGTGEETHWGAIHNA